jgi:hypothetical protein
VLRRQVTLDKFGMLKERLVEDGLGPDEFVFLSVAQDLSDYDFIPNQQITMLSIAVRIVPLAVATKGKNWEFHKTDADPWPSKLHAHFYDGGIKLDAITGKIYKVSGRQYIGVVKERELRRIQLALLGSKDFGQRTRECLGETRIAGLLPGRAAT